MAEDIEFAKDAFRRIVGSEIFDGDLNRAKTAVSALVGIAIAQHPTEVSSFYRMLEEVPLADSSTLDGIFRAVLHF